MPFTGPGDSNLPDHVKQLSEELRNRWVGAWNGRFEDCRADDGSMDDCESSAFAVANAAVKEIDVKFGGNDFIESFDVYERQIPQSVANYNSLGATAQRACANCQWFKPPNACIVVENFPEPIVPNGLSDEWRQRVTQEEMQMPIAVMIVGGMGESDIKQSKRERGQDFPPEDFAVVPDAQTPSTWKLRLTESPGTLSVAQIGRAITAMQPGGFRGNPVELTSSQKRQAISRISGAIRRVDADDDQKRNLRERLDDVKDVSIVIHGSPSMSKGLKSAISEMVRKFLTISQPSNQKTIDSDFVDLLTGESGFKIFKDADGEWRWFSRVSNNFRDRDNPPEIFTEEAHLNFVKSVDENGKMPKLWLWHTPKAEIGQADWVDYVDNFLLESGTIYPQFSGVAEKLAKDSNLGVSHGYYYIHSDADNGLIGWYNSFETSVLPRMYAANPWADIAFLKKESDMGLNPTKRAFLVDKLGEETVKEIESGTAELAKALRDAGIEYKDILDDDSANADDKNGVIPANLDAKSIADAFVQSQGFKNLVTEVNAIKTTVAEIEGIKERLDKLEASDDDKIANRINAAASKIAGAYQASKSDDNVVDKKDTDDGPDAGEDILSGILQQAQGVFGEGVFRGGDSAQLVR